MRLMIAEASHLPDLIRAAPRRRTVRSSAPWPTGWPNSVTRDYVSERRAAWTWLLILGVSVFGLGLDVVRAVVLDIGCE
jgi:hypothetical protein